MTSDAIRLRILSQATEDLTGLWELAAAPEAPSLDRLIAAVSSLAEERLIAVFRGTRFASEEQELETAAARRELRDKRFWDWSAPERGPHLRVFATPKGREWYFSQGQAALVPR